MNPRSPLSHLQGTATCLCPEPDQCNPCSHPTSWKPILFLSSLLNLDLPRGLFPSSFLAKTLYAPLLSLIRATCPDHLILLDLIIRIMFGLQYRLLSSSLWTFLHFSVTSSILGTNILLSTLLSNTLSLRPSLNMSDQVSHPYKPAFKIIVPFFLHLYIVWLHTGRQKFCTER